MRRSLQQTLAMLQAKEAARDAGPSHDEMNSRAYPWWGKAGHGPAAHHSALPVHLMAVSAALEVLLNDQLIEQALASAWGTDISSIRRMKPWLVWVAALHDLGKVMSDFQNKRPDVVAWIGTIRKGRECAPPKLATGFDHSVEGGLKLIDWLLADLEIPAQSEKPSYLKVALAQHIRPKLARPLFAAAFAHHGYHPGDQGAVMQRFSPIIWSDIGANVKELAWSLAETIDACVGPFGPMIEPAYAGAVEHLFAGLVALADWLGSDEQVFPFIDCKRFAQEFPAGAEWRALYRDFVGRAHRRISSLGAFDLVPDGRLSVADVVILGGHSPRSVQMKSQEAAKWLVDTNMNTGTRGGLLIVEAPMGVGKTEAAFLAARVFMISREAAGLAFALPAQASANMLFKRLFPLANHVFGLEQPTLAHGQASFAAERINRDRSAVEGEREGHESSAHLDEWITDDQKKAFLSPLCACTVDQMEMAAMHSKHGSVRYATLARQVVVIDEVHAYDTYMQTVLSSLLGMLGAAGAPVILLSATLPARIRMDLIEAYTGKRSICDEDGKTLDSFVGSSYPVIHAVAKPRGGDAVPASLRTWTAPWTDPLKKVSFRWCADSDWLDQAVEKALLGLSVVVLANTVKSARKRHRLLVKRLAQEADSGIRKPILLHSRFRGEDRLTVQGQIERLLGRTSTQTDRRGVVVVATQVLEQSIDIDADVMFSEAAPIDLLLQRSGRLHRHERSYRSVGAEFFIIVPDDVCQDAQSSSEDLSKAMCDPQLPKWWRSTLIVYSEGSKVPATMQMLRSLSSNVDGSLALTIEVPTDIPRLVDAVYGGEDSSRTLKQMLAGRRAQSVTLNSGAAPGALALGAIRSSSTRLSDDGNVGMKFLCVVEDIDGQLSIPAGGSPIDLKSLLSVDGQRINPQFIAQAQPWLLTIPRRSAEGVRLLSHRASKDQLNFDWRFNEPVDPADKTRHDPPFFILRVRSPQISLTRCAFELCPGLHYDSELGVFDAESD